MKYRINVLRAFEREAKRLGKRYPSLRDDIKELGAEILENPHLGTDLGGGLRKIRMAITSKGRGKSGGARVITFTVVVSVAEAITFTVVVSVAEAEINLLYIYDKAERSSISKKEIAQLIAENL